MSTLPFSGAWYDVLNTLGSLQPLLNRLKFMNYGDFQVPLKRPDKSAAYVHPCKDSVNITKNIQGR